MSGAASWFPPPPGYAGRRAVAPPSAWARPATLAGVSDFPSPDTFFAWL